ncbi:MAG: excinuclease ABC subunit UvrC [Proteobacteria bacterium]|nr:excinuclease ABC subunit UvrC [Pseudomonadota bacterium]
MQVSPSFENNIIKEALKTLASSPGVYRMLNQKGEVLYVGKAKNLKKRVHSYTQIAKLPTRLKRMVSETHQLEVVITRSETEALLLESNLIKKFQPPYNILLKDDKSFPYILLTNDHMFPRLMKHRGPQNQKGQYFGPFASSQAVDETIILLQKIFQLRSCSDSYFAARTRPCLQYHIKRCSAPCRQKISSFDYNQNVKQAVDFLNGKNDQVQQYLAHKMQQASEQLAYEEAGQYRDRLKLLTHIQTRQRINVAGLQNCDVIAIDRLGSQTCVQLFFFRHSRNFGTESFFLSHAQESSLEESLAAFIKQFYQERSPAPLILLSHPLKDLKVIQKALNDFHHTSTKWEIPKLGIKKDVIDHALMNAKKSLERKLSHEKLLEKLATLFDLEESPKRIEVYDNSHLYGSHPYGVMIVATKEGFDKKSYRKFSIKAHITPGDDYGMMREVIKRRFKHEESWELPNLMLIDGGQGQLQAVERVMKEMSIFGPKVVAIAKGPQRKDGQEKFFIQGKESFSLESHSAELHFLQRLRDEAHRFALGTHRSKREKNLSKSVLDDIPGVGLKRKKLLLRHFGSAQAVSRAVLQDLLIVPGINKSIAKKIYQYFHER